MIERLIAAAEQHFGESLEYLRQIARTSPAAFWKFSLGFFAFSNHRSKAPKDVYWLARLGATRAEDCGPCVQTVVNLALSAGVPAGALRAALDGAPFDAKLEAAYRFGYAVSANDMATVEEIRPALVARYGEAALTDLAIGIASARVYPALKRALGYARSCSTVTVRLPA